MGHGLYEWATELTALSTSSRCITGASLANLGNGLENTKYPNKDWQIITMYPRYNSERGWSFFEDETKNPDWSASEDALLYA